MNILTKSNKEITFVMLTWNRRHFVQECLGSFFANFSGKYSFEYRIIDNGSDDGTVEHLKDYAKKHPEIIVKYNKKNKGLKEYKRLLNSAKGKYIIIIDDDVIKFPKDFDKYLVEGINEAKQFGFLALDVVQDEYTNGAKPTPDNYKEVKVGKFLIQEGPTGGWCAIIRADDFKKIKLKFNIGKMDMGKSEDARISWLVKNDLGLKTGILNGKKCYHACGVYYSKKFGYLKRDITKYKEAGLTEFVKTYSQRDKKQ